jgi:DNA-binding winged helix-turn-helix (wHTH) protein/TolB-like protein
MPKRLKHFYEFGEFRLDEEKHRLIRQGQPIHLSPKSFEALVVLVKNAGTLLEREVLMQAVWRDTFVEDANLTVTISNLRKALGQNGEHSEYIETIPRVGYRFVADVRESYEEPKSLIIEKHTQSRTIIEEEFVPETDPKETQAIVVMPPKIALGAYINRRRVLAASACMAILGFGSLVYFRAGNGRAAATNNSTLPAIKSMAVLPPRSLGDEPENVSQSLGIADALITRLASMHKVAVRPSSAVARYVGAEQDPISIGRSLAVEAVLDGTLQHAQGRLRVTLRLLNVSNGNQLWSGKLDESETDIFKLQDSISQLVGNALYPRLTRNEQALLIRQSTTNKEAYALYLQGNYFWNKRGSQAARSIEYFHKAIELDPNFAEAYVSLAAVDATATGAAEAEALAEKALQLDPTSGDAHATLGFIKMFRYWDWPSAERELDRAIELNPDSAVAHHWKGVYLSIRGRLDEAKGEMHRALELDPLSLIIMTDIGQLHYFAHEYDQASDYCNRVLTFDPEFHDAHTYLIDIYRMKGMDSPALNEFARSYSLGVEATRAQEALFAREGLRGVFAAELQTQLKQFKSDGDQRNSWALLIGRSYCRLGDNEQALKWLAVAVENPQSFWTPYLNVDPLYDGVRNDSRFKQILNRLNLGN